MLKKIPFIKYLGCPVSKILFEQVKKESKNSKQYKITNYIYLWIELDAKKLSHKIFLVRLKKEND